LIEELEATRWQQHQVEAAALTIELLQQVERLDRGEQAGTPGTDRGAIDQVGVDLPVDGDAPAPSRAHRDPDLPEDLTITGSLPAQFSLDRAGGRSTASPILHL
jgi:hypothetical protein